MNIATKEIVKIDSRCIDCFLKTYRGLFDKFGIPKQQQEDFMIYFNELMKLNPFASPPEIQRELSRKFNSVTGIDDPFAEEKEESNRLATELYLKWKPKVVQPDQSFELALRLSIAGNIMDYGANNSFDIHKTIEYVISADFAIDHTNRLKQRIRQAKSILYLGDNAGEIVFDKLFLETIGHSNVTFAVRGANALNDATVEDARKMGIDTVASIISNGFDAPSTLLEKSSEEFLQLYHSADLIISKGMGNLEGLIHEKDPRIFFLLMVKCEVIAEIIGAPKASFVVYNEDQAQ